MSKLKKDQTSMQRYIKLLIPQGNDNDGFTVSNEFERVFFKYSAQGLDNQTEEMMNEWIYNKVKQEDDAIFKGISSHSKIKT